MLSFTLVKRIIPRFTTRSYSIVQDNDAIHDDDSKVPLNSRKLVFFNGHEAPYNCKLNLIGGKHTRFRAASPTNIYDQNYNPILDKFIKATMRVYGKGAIHMRLQTALEQLPAELKKIHPDLNLSGLQIFIQAVNNVKPQADTRILKKGFLEIHKPKVLNEPTQLHLAKKWIKTAIEEKLKNDKSLSYEKAFIEEIIDAFEKRGNAWDMRVKAHKKATANIAFIHTKF